MRRAISLILAGLLTLAFSQVANAQGGFGNTTGWVTSTCGTISPTYKAGNPGPFTLDIDGNLCISGSISASLTPFAPGAAYATLTATGSSADVALPAGTVVVLQNTGTTAVSCILSIGSSVATASKNIIQPGSTAGFTVGSNTHASCIDQTGSTSNLVVLSGGAGLPAWAGGGGGGGGAVTIADGADVALGTTSDAAWSSGSGTAIAILKNIAGGIAGSIPAGSALIGKVGIDQTTPGTTNGVALVGVNGATALAGNGVTGTGSPRVTIASDNTPFTVNAPDPCGGSATKVNVPISQTGNTKLISATSAKKNYVCSIIFNASDAENISIVEGTGSTCGTSTAAILGGTTAAAGMHFAANGGMARGGGNSWVMGATGTNVDMCLFQSGSGTIAGNLVYVQQ